MIIKKELPQIERTNIVKNIKIKKHRPILKIIRTLMDVPLNKITYFSGRHIPGINAMENGTTKHPLESTIVSICESLAIKADIVLYSFGYLPNNEKEIISSDPFFYREKILELCNNHESRYEDNIDVDLLNIRRTADYIENNRCERTKRGKRKNEDDKN